MDNKVKIRAYRDADHPAMKRVLSESGMFWRRWDGRDVVKKKISKLPGSVIVAEIDGKVVGCIYAQTQEGWQSFLWRLAVLKKYRKRGVGTKLLKNAERFIAKKGSGNICMIVDSKRPELHSYYKKLGYRTSGNPYIFFFKGR